MNKLLLIAIIIIGVFIVAAIAGASRGPANPTTAKGKIYTFTVKAGVGADIIKVTNMNTGASIRLTAADLPASFNFTENDALTFNVTAKPGYAFNYWYLVAEGDFQSKNPLTIKATGSFTIEARFLIVEEELT